MGKSPEKEGYSIGEVADLLQIATSKLRHWEAMDLFSVEKQPNHYRRYDMADVVNIAEVLTYRELGFPISRIEEMRRADVADYEQLLRLSRAELHKKLEEYRSILKRMDQQRAAIRDLKKLDACWPRAEAVPFERVVKFDYEDAENIRRYIHHPALYVRYFDTQDLATETRGIVAAPADPGQTLWAADAQLAQPGWETVAFPIREKPDRDYVTDLPGSLETLRERWHTGVLLAQYVFTAYENGERTDFYKAYLAVRPR